MVAASKSASALARRSRLWVTSCCVPFASSATTSSCGGRAGQRAVEPLLGADQPLADALPELAGGHAREGHEQELLERRALGDVARGERGDGERLAGARARLEDGDPGRQRAADVERLDVGGEAAHRSKTASVCRRPFQRRTDVAAEARRLGVVPAVALLVGARRLCRQLVEARGCRRGRAGARARRPPWGSSSPTPTPLRAAFSASAPCVSGCRVGRGGHAGERERLAHAAVVEVDEGRELLSRPLARGPLGGRRAAGSGRS